MGITLTPRRLSASHGSRLLLVTTIIAATTASCTREPSQQQSVPIDLATALAAAGGFGATGEPQILVGRLPEWFADRMYVPPQARLLGSAFQGRTLVAALVVPSLSDTVVQHLQHGLTQRGWTLPPSSSSFIGGFPPQRPSATQAATRFTVCRERQTLNAWIWRRQDDSTTVLVRLYPPADVSVCNEPQSSAVAQRAEFPALTNPAGFDASPGSACWPPPPGGMSMSTTRLQTTLNPDAILEHYARQLSDSGWSPLGGASVGRTWTHAHPTGAHSQVSITVSAPLRDPSCREIQFVYRSLSRP